MGNGLRVSRAWRKEIAEQLFSHSGKGAVFQKRLFKMA
jgi:hypothetical protein